MRSRRTRISRARRFTDDAQLNELATSIKEVGMLQPLILTMDGEDEYGARYHIIAGERRWRAAQLAGLETVPAIIRETTPQQMLEIALIENLQRRTSIPWRRRRAIACSWTSMA